MISRKFKVKSAVGERVWYSVLGRTTFTSRSQVRSITSFNPALAANGWPETWLAIKEVFE